MSHKLFVQVLEQQLYISQFAMKYYRWDGFVGFAPIRHIWLASSVLTAMRYFSSSMF